MHLEIVIPEYRHFAVLVRSQNACRIEQYEYLRDYWYARLYGRVYCYHF